MVNTMRWRTYVAYEHGIEKFISKSGKARGNDITVKLDLPGRSASRIQRRSWCVHRRL